jgi:hypothetical protein
MMIPTPLSLHPYTGITYMGHGNMSTMFGTYISSTVDEGSHPIWSSQESFWFTVRSQWSFPADSVSNEEPFLLTSLRSLTHVSMTGNGHWEHTMNQKDFG